MLLIRIFQSRLLYKSASIFLDQSAHISLHIFVIINEHPGKINQHNVKKRLNFFLKILVISIDKSCKRVMIEIYSE